MLICQYCNKECKNKNSWAQHEIRCPKNPERIEIYKRYGKDHHNFGKKGKNHFTKAREQGMEVLVSDETRKKISESHKKRTYSKWTSEQKARHSEIMQNVVKENIDSYTKNNVCGRVKTVYYKEYKLKGSWEVTVAKWLDNQDIEWYYEYNKEYYEWNDKIKIYVPDFYLPEYNTYIEVKGYQTSRDIAKWNNVSKPLIIVDKRVIHNLDNLSIKNLFKNNIWNVQN